MRTRLLLLLSLLPAAGFAQLTTDQRMADFRNLADLYARRYAAIPWKQTAIHFDPLHVKPWLDRISAVATDLDFYDLMVEYVSDLQDAHDQYNLPSDFDAHLGFTVDIYDGVLRIDSIDRSVLPALRYPFQVGDQLVSVDGVAVADLVKGFSKYVSGGNPRTVQRLAAVLITDRYQALYPYAHRLVDTAAVVIQGQSGDAGTFDIPWSKSGIPLTTLGASPGPDMSSLMKTSKRAAPRELASFYQQFFQQIRNYRLPGRTDVMGFGQIQPVFDLPAGFVQRLGSKSYDSYYSGSYLAPDGTRIGYLRIADFWYPSLTTLDKEIRFFQLNTDVLVVDVMRNPGGDACAAEDILSRLTKSQFRGLVAEFRVDWTDILNVNAALADAQAFGADDDTIALLNLYLTEFPKAFSRTGGRTGALPVCESTAAHNAAPVNYTKPILLLVDEMSASAADIFAAIAQDNHIAPLFGDRTMGAGGSPEQDHAGIYSEGATTVTRSLAVRAQPIVTPDYPTSAYIENIGVRPETTVDYMTADNLLNRGRSFVNAFTAAAAGLANPHP